MTGAAGQTDAGQDGPGVNAGGLASESRSTALAAIEGVLDLMQDGSRPYDEQRPYTVTCHSNGYGLWLIPSVPELMSTRALTAEELLAMIEARAELQSGTPSGSAAIRDPGVS